MKDPNFPDRKPINLSDSQVGELLFNILGLDHKACLETDMKTGRYDTREMVVPANTDLSKLLTTHTPHIFKEHEIFISLLNNQYTKVTFRGVPIGTPDEELLYTCLLHGEVTSNKVEREPIRVGGANRYTLTSSTRIVKMKLHPG